MGSTMGSTMGSAITFFMFVAASIVAFIYKNQAVKADVRSRRSSIPIGWKWVSAIISLFILHGTSLDRIIFTFIAIFLVLCLVTTSPQTFLGSVTICLVILVIIQSTIKPNEQLQSHNDTHPFVHDQQEKLQSD